MNKNNAHLPRLDRLFQAISKDPRKVKTAIMLLDTLAAISLSGNLEKLGLQATAGRRFLDSVLED